MLIDCRGLRADHNGGVFTKKFIPGTGTIHFNNIRCHGNETSILCCDLDVADPDTCSHSHDLGIICEQCKYM